MVPSDSEEDVDQPDGPGASNIPPTIYVIKFHPATKRIAVEWFLEKIEAKQKYGGAELFVRSEPQKEGQGVVVHVSATKIKLLEVAETCEIQKQTVNGLVQELTVRDLDQFLYTGQNLDNVLTPADRVFCVRHELEGIRAKQDEGYIPGYRELKLFPGQSIMGVYIAEELISKIYPLHDRSALDHLSSHWYKTLFQSAPLEEIRSYFGEGIAMYFCFLGFYTLALFVPAVLGIVQMCLSVDTLTEYALFAAFNLIWATVFLEFWKRRCAELSYRWGTLEKPSQLEEPRANHRGEMIQNSITKRFEPFYPEWKTRCKVHFVSIPIVGLCILGALYVMVMGFWAEEQLIDWKKRYGSSAGVFIHFPSALYAVIVWLMNFYYKKLASRLTEWENHRTQAAYDWHRIAKLVVFEVINNFSSLFYIAFYIRDMDMLCSQVATMLIVTQMINHFQEALLPYVVQKAYNQFADKILKQLKSHEFFGQFFQEPVRPVHNAPIEDQVIPVLSLDPKDPRIQQSQEENDLDPYNEIYDDYLEMFLQFGYVFLFSSVYPMAAFWAVLNNILELKTDAFKLCRVFQRPKVKKVGNIGIWQSAFEILGAIAVITNTALLCLSPRLRPLAPNASPSEWILLFVALEHIILAIKVYLMWNVNDKPQWVRDALDKVYYQSKLALKNERGKKTRRHLSRRFRSVHGVPRSGSRSRATTPVAQNGGLRHRSPSGRDYGRGHNY